MTVFASSLHTTLYKMFSCCHLFSPDRNQHVFFLPTWPFAPCLLPGPLQGLSSMVREGSPLHREQLGSLVGLALETSRAWLNAGYFAQGRKPAWQLRCVGGSLCGLSLRVAGLSVFDA